ncbi:unnamed protein product [Arabis nemorensis]|uniref:Uncharacterized protein n=1 Tax=Arabis nemorensis TaxID=586526 RepID=A0A565CRK5_9BRAS|nr:unnamed protein product [Arabis nemorensis]
MLGRCWDVVRVPHRLEYWSRGRDRYREGVGLGSILGWYHTTIMASIGALPWPIENLLQHACGSRVGHNIVIYTRVRYWDFSVTGCEIRYYRS